MYICFSVLHSQSYFIVWDCMDVMGLDGSHEKSKVYCNIIIPRHTAKMDTQLPPTTPHALTPTSNAASNRGGKDFWMNH